MATDKHWMEKAFKNAHGQLHKSLGIPGGEKIPAEKLARATHSVNPALRRRAQAAENARKANEY